MSTAFVVLTGPVGAPLDIPKEPIRVNLGLKGSLTELVPVLRAGLRSALDRDRCCVFTLTVHTEDCDHEW